MYPLFFVHIQYILRVCTSVYAYRIYKKYDLVVLLIGRTKVYTLLYTYGIYQFFRPEKEYILFYVLLLLAGIYTHYIYIGYAS